MTKDAIIFLLKNTPSYLEHIDNQEEWMCLTAVKQDGISLQYVKNQNPRICLEALKENPASYQHVRIVPNPDFGTTIKNLKKKQLILDSI